MPKFPYVAKLLKAKVIYPCNPRIVGQKPLPARAACASSIRIQIPNTEFRPEQIE